MAGKLRALSLGKLVRIDTDKSRGELPSLPSTPSTSASSASSSPAHSPLERSSSKLPLLTSSQKRSILFTSSTSNPSLSPPSNFQSTFASSITKAQSIGRRQRWKFEPPLPETPLSLVVKSLNEKTRGIRQQAEDRPEPFEKCSSVAIPILSNLRLRDIAQLQFASCATCRFCHSPENNKLLAPIFSYRPKWVSYIDMPSVCELYADDASLVSLGQNQEFCTCLQLCTSLKKLYCSMNGKLMAQLFSRALSNLRGLIVLDVSQNRLAIDDRGLIPKAEKLDCFFPALPSRLRVLDLSHNLLGDNHAYLLVDALDASFTNSGCGLEELLLRSNMLGNGSGFAFGRLMRSPAGADLQRLDMRTNRVEAEGACAMLDALYLHSRMKEMRVGYNRQNTKQDLDTARVASILLQKALSEKSANQLELLDLNNVRVGDLGAQRLASAIARNSLLRRLDLAFNSIGPDGAKAIAGALEQNCYLKELDLRDNEIGDEGAYSFATALLKNTTLRRLQLARNGISGRGALSLRSAIGENDELCIEFGASGDESSQLQGLMSRTPSLANLRFMRGAERESFGIQGSGDQLRSLMFSY